MGIIANYPIWNVLDEPLPEIKKDSVIIFPTETVYGIGVFLSNKKGIDRIFEIKKREKKPLSLHLPDCRDLMKYVEPISNYAEKAISHYSPGPLMMILNAKKDFKFPEMCVLNGKIGVRIFSNFITASIVNNHKEPIIGTSANISGGGSPKNFFDIPADLIDECDYAIDNGPTVYQKDSTIVDFTGPVPLILREGAISAEELCDVLSVKVERGI